MKPVFQKRLTPPNGDCVNACIASILEVDLEEIPNLVWYDKKGNYYSEINKYLKEKIECEICRSMAPPYKVYGGVATNMIYIKNMVFSTDNKGGKAAHAVLYQGDKIIHDPHPKQPYLFIKPEGCYYLWLQKVPAIVR